MHVHEAERDRGEERLGKELSERDDHADLGAARRDLVGDLTCAFGRATAQPERDGGGLHRAGLGRATPAAAPVGLGDDERDLVAGVVQRAQRGDGVGGVPKKTRRTTDAASRLGYRAARSDLARGPALGWREGLGRELAGPQLAQRRAADVGLEPVEQQHAVEVVDLVLDHAGEQVVALEHDLLAVEVDAAHRDPLGAHDLELEARAPRGSPLPTRSRPGARRSRG